VNNLKMYILVNQDISMGKGKIAGQVGHAVNILTYRMCKQNNELIDEYMNGAIKKIVLKCPQSKLEELESKNYISVRDNGLTQLEPNTLTAVTLGILREEEVESWVKELKLL